MSTTPLKPKSTPKSKPKSTLLSPSTPLHPPPRRPHKRRRAHFRKVAYDGALFEPGDDVYVKRREGADSDADDPEVEDCRICFAAGRAVMVECDDCLGGFHLRCLRPPLRRVPEGDWVCGFCKAKREGRVVERPRPPDGVRVRRTARERLLAGDLWAARIQSLWKESGGVYWANICWYMIPEETSAGRQKHNLKRELYRTNDYDDIEVESILRHCYIMNPTEFAKAYNEGDDVFLCEYEYDVRWHSFKRIANADDDQENVVEAHGDKDWDSSTDNISDSEGDSECEKEQILGSSVRNRGKHDAAANSHKGRIYGLQRIGIKKIPELVRCHKQTEIERAKATLLLVTLPKTLPCRNKEMMEITAFVKGAICEDQCLGRCLYVHGVPGTGKTMSVLSVMRSIKSEVDARKLRPYRFVEINCLKLASPENIYKVIYEALTGYRVGWKKALHLLNDKFSESSNSQKHDDQPCVLLIDELDLLVTRNQSVLYNILDWPTKRNSKLVIIGIANTMDLPEKLLPRISSRMGIQRLCFGPYNYQQLQEIILCRLNGINAFDKQAIEFASRKVAAISGDARRALEVCRRAAELADYRLKQLNSGDAGECLVSMSDVEDAIKEMFQAPHIQIMRNCSRIGKIILAAMVYELYKTGTGEVTLEKLGSVVLGLCSTNGENFPGWDTLLKVSCKLGECKIILCEEPSKHKLQKLQLNFPSDDVSFALKNCQEVPWLAKYL